MAHILRIHGDPVIPRGFEYASHATTRILPLRCRHAQAQHLFREFRFRQLALHLVLLLNHQVNWCYGSLPKAPVMHLDENAVNKLDGPSEQESADLLPHQIPVIGLRLV
jgi:hypothetical protein